MKSDIPLAAPPVALKDSWWLKRSGGESFDVSLKIAAAADIISTIFYTIYVDHMKNFVVLPAKNNNHAGLEKVVGWYGNLVFFTLQFLIFF